MKITLVLAVVLSLMISMSASATVFMSGGDPDYNMIASKINAGAPNLATDNENYLTCDALGWNKFLVNFTGLSVIPTGSIINSATIKAWSCTGGGSTNVTLQSLLKPIGPGSGTLVPGSTTWMDNLVGTSSWSTPGLGAGTDYAAAVDPGVLYTGAWNWAVHDIKASLQQQVNSGHIYGWIATKSAADQTAYWYHQFYAMGMNPQIVVDYTAPVPEPGSMLALGSGLMGLIGFARRRRA